MRYPTSTRPQVHFDWRPTPMVKRLLFIHFGIWLAFSIMVNFAGSEAAAVMHGRHLALTPTTAVYELHFWQVFTYMWLHDLQAAMHIIGNMLALFFLGPSLERRWGGRDFLRFYIASGVVAGVVSVILGLVAPATFGGSVVGASGATMAILAAFAFSMPNARILLFFVLPLKAKWLLWGVVAIDTLTFFVGRGDHAWHTHMGGILGAWLLITGNWRPQLLVDRGRLWWLRHVKQRRLKKVGLRVIPGGKEGKAPERRYLN